jgi:hypothetical protein
MIGHVVKILQIAFAITLPITMISTILILFVLGLTSADNRPPDFLGTVGAYALLTDIGSISILVGSLISLGILYLTGLPKKNQ